MSRVPARAVLITFLVALSGCTPQYRLQSLQLELAERPAEGPPAGLEGYQDLRGAIHVHSYLSHDSEGTHEEIVRSAQEAGLDFIIMTDHDHPEIFREGMQGRYEDVLVIRGMEMIKGCRGTADLCASLLAVGIRDYFDHRPLTFQQVIDEVHRQGGLAIVAHPRGWREWSLDGMTGIEIYDILDDVMDKKWKFPKFFLDILYSYRKYPDEVFISIQDQPRWHLDKWDELTQTRKIVGIAGNDSHQNVRVMGRQLDPYLSCFRFVSPHILALKLDEETILSALKEGHAYVAFDLLSDATGFGFALTDQGKSWLMGEEVRFGPGQTLTVRLPQQGRIVLIRDGQEVNRCGGCSELSLPVEGPGVYRVEAFLRIQNRWRPWIFSNPIYVR